MGFVIDEQYKHMYLSRKMHSHTKLDHYCPGPFLNMTFPQAFSLLLQNSALFFNVFVANSFDSKEETNTLAMLLLPVIPQEHDLGECRAVAGVSLVACLSMMGAVSSFFYPSSCRIFYILCIRQPPTPPLSLSTHIHTLFFLLNKSHLWYNIAPKCVAHWVW